MDAAPAATPGQQHIGHRRRDCWWEPIFDPEFVLDQEPYDWDLQRDAGPYRRFVPASTLAARIKAGETLEVRGILFRECDFQGAFEGDPIIMFDQCRFIACDLAYSTWRRCHFKDCTFQDCSISLASFHACELRGCSWSNIGIASRTEMNKTFLSNPGQLIAASVSGRDPRRKTWEHRMHQWFRLRGTRAHFLRTVMLSHATTGDEHTYYETVRLHELERSSARVAQDIYETIFGPGWRRLVAIPATVLHSFNYAIMRALGSLNGWGESASRPFMALLACWIVFGAIYSKVKFASRISAPFQKSFDLTFIIGYGNQVAPSDPMLTFVQDIHALAAIVIYSVFFATVISKLSRAR
ncbi:pentapeptide repeat-containing protein [Sphingomonas sp. S2-65]|uniref:anti-phage Hailong system effector protein HalA n=1 Tax=Sphingomonas sp. S2-65 TaxID=2903960 RepID=UPI001F393B5B|nr:pentapeptide repeat-containing protein [Sphingomonas sp. S2-65]UYY60015.1 pentapeptide repeat-containing protein [Sphingomonas sp. S2-65]